MTNLFFRSDRNYLKRDTASVATTMAAPVTPAYLSGLAVPNLYVTNLAIPHTLGPKVPVFRAFYEPWGDGAIFPALTSRLNGYTRNPRGTNNDGPGLIAWADSSNVYLQLYLSVFRTPLTGTFPVYAIIYRDYSLV